MMRRSQLTLRAVAISGLFVVVLVALIPLTAAAGRIENKVAVFSALDKVTASIKKLQVPLGKTEQFGALRITPRACYSRPATEKPKTTSFVEVEETMLDGTSKRLFSGWMFAESPGLNAVEHPVFDVWLTGCEEPTNTIARETLPSGDPNAAAGSSETPAAPPRRRRVRR